MKVEPLKTYTITIVCHNCKSEFVIKIEFGRTVNDYCIYTPCENCGCFMLDAK